MKDRGMMKWAPYKSLIEQEVELKRWRKNREKVSRPMLMEDKMQEINEFLTNYHNQLCLISYFADGYIYQVKGIISDIDLNTKILKIEGEKIKIYDIVDAEDLPEEY